MKTSLQVDCCATNYRLPETNVGVLGFYETPSGYRTAIVYLEETDGLWYESRLIMREDADQEVDKPDLWCELSTPKLDFIE